MINEITYIFDPRDVSKLKTDKICDVVCEQLKKLFDCNDIEIKEKGYNKIVFVIKSGLAPTDAELSDHKKTILSELDINDVQINAVSKDADEKSAEKPSDSESNSAKEETEGGPAVLKNEELPSVDERIEELVGNSEIKRFADEIRKISAFYKDKSALRRAILGMSYLVAVNQGNGRSTIAKLMGDIVSEQIGEPVSRFSEYCISDSSPDAVNATIEPLIRELGHLNSAKNGFNVYVIHLDGMKSKLSSSAWARFLNAAWDANDNAFFIFMISYREDMVLMDIHKKIDDVLCNKVMKVAPFTNEMYISLFEAELKKSGIGLSEDAHSSLIKKIAEEKADGSFYGINTVRKICNELMFYKASAASGDAGDEVVIKKEDVDILLADVNVSDESGIENLEKLVALDGVKERVREILAMIKLKEASGAEDVSMHMMFSGAPGTGKTAVARIIGQIFKEENILTKGDFYEVGRKDLVGSYVGTTAPKTAEVCKSAYGSVLFIDEAYSLAVDSPNDYGSEAVSTLIAEMENNRGNLIVIFAGYDDELQKLFDLNPGLRDRVPYHIHFPNYSRKELLDIFYMKLPDEFKYDDEFADEAKKYFDNLSDEIVNDKNFSNGRFVRNLVERVMSKAALRIEINRESERMLIKNDFVLAVSDIEYQILNAKQPKKRSIGFLS